MPASVKLADEHEDDLTVLFVEVQGLGQEEALSFALEKKWLGNDALWTTERPFQSGSRGIPSAVLLSADGAVVLKGNPLSMKSAFEDAVKAEIKRAKSGPDDAPPAVKKAWSDFAKGRYGQALSAARKAAEAGGNDAAAAEEAAARMEQRIASKLSRADWMMEHGLYIEAQSLVEELAKNVKGAPQLEEQVAERKTRLDSAELDREIDAAKDLAKLEQKLYAEGGGERVVKQLESFIAKNEGTKAAERAQRLVALGSESPSD